MKQLSSLNNRICFLTVLEDGSPRSRCQQFCLLTRPLSLTCRWSPSPRVPTQIFLCVHASLDSPFLLIRTSGVLNEVPTSIPHLTLITSLKALVSNTVSSGVRASTYEYERPQSRPQHSLKRKLHLPIDPPALLSPSLHKLPALGY